MHGGLLITVRRMVCADGKPPAPRPHKLFHFQAPSRLAAGPPQPPLPPSRLPLPRARLPLPMDAEQDKGHTDPFLRAGVQAHLKSSQPRAGAWGPSSLGTAGVPELSCRAGQDGGAAGEEWDGGRAGRVTPGPCPSLGPSVSSSWDVCRQKGLPANEGRGWQTRDADTHPTPTPATAKERLDVSRKPHIRQEGGKLGSHSTNEAHPPRP